MPAEDFVQGGRLEPQPVQAFEFDAQPLDAEPSLATQADDQLDLALPNLLCRERHGCRLRSINPASPPASYRLSHLRSVGREMLNRRQTAPASPSSW